MELFESGETVRICAPMVRYSKLAFRLLVRLYGCDIAFRQVTKRKKLDDVKIGSFQSNDYGRFILQVAEGPRQRVYHQRPGQATGRAVRGQPGGTLCRQVGLMIYLKDTTIILNAMSTVPRWWLPLAMAWISIAAVPKDGRHRCESLCVARNTSCILRSVLGGNRCLSDQQSRVCL